MARVRSSGTIKVTYDVEGYPLKMNRIEILLAAIALEAKMINEKMFVARAEPPYFFSSAFFAVMSTSSMIPYSLACAADMKLSRSVSCLILSAG